MFKFDAKLDINFELAKELLKKNTLFNTILQSYLDILWLSQIILTPM